MDINIGDKLLMKKKLKFCKKKLVYIKEIIKANGDI